MSFLLALNVTSVDLFVLDVEFMEEPILKNFDFKRFDVQVRTKLLLYFISHIPFDSF